MLVLNSAAPANNIIPINIFFKLLVLKAVQGGVFGPQCLKVYFMFYSLNLVPERFLQNTWLIMHI